MAFIWIIGGCMTFIPGIIASQNNVVDFVAIPLTYDEFLSDDTTSLTRNGDGQHITDLGFLGNGSDSRYSYSMPSLSGGDIGNIYFQASIKPLEKTRNSTYDRDVIASLSDGSQPAFQFAIVPDDTDTDSLQVGFRGREDGEALDTVYKMGRKNWRFEGQFPVITNGGYDARPQSILFNSGDDGYLTLAHYEDNDSYFYKVDSSGVVTDNYNFGSASHFSSLARDSAGDVYTVDYTSGNLYKIDESASESSGNFTASLTYDMSAITQLGTIEFVTVSGTEYLLAAQYLTSGTPYIYVIPKTEITDSGTFSLTDRYKRFVIEQRNQGATFHSGLLYVSGNRFTADVTATGVIFTYDIEDAIQNTADNGSLTVLSSWEAPTRYVEDIDFDSAGRMWTLTEGSSSVGDFDGFLSLWSTAFVAQENTYSVYYDGSNITLKINNLLFDSYVFDSEIETTSLEMGGPSPSVETTGFLNGYYIGYLRDVYISRVQANESKYNFIEGGNYEPNTLTKVSLSLVNPGAESGVTGWTNEVGSIGNRSSNPAPYAGSSYFFGGANLQTISTQSIDILTETGLTQNDLNNKTAWVMIEWHQSAFGGADTDTGSMGVAFIDGGVEGSRIYQEEINTGSQDWFQRSFSYSHVDDVDEIKVVYKADRLNGTNLDCYIDDIKAYIYYQ